MWSDPIIPLLMAGVPLARVLKRIRQVREARYGAMRGYFRGLTDELDDETTGERLASILVDTRLGGQGKSLLELDLESLGATLVNLRRRGAHAFEYGPETRLAAGDILILRGEPEALAAAEMRLAEG